MSNTPALEVMIAAYGADGMRRVAEGSHPRVEGVEYTVCWQKPQGEIPEEIAGREDFRVIESGETGLSRNRNLGLDKARCQLLLIADDDTDYTPESLRGVIEAFARHPECGFLTFRFETEKGTKSYPNNEFDWTSPPKGMYLSSVELALRREAAGVRFDERFGAGSVFAAGEEQLFLHSLMRKGIKGRYVPLTVCRHPGETTAERVDPRLLTEAKGAAFRLLYPFSWPLRMLTHAMRSADKAAYCKAWLRGASALHSSGNV